MNVVRRGFLAVNRFSYERLARPLIFHKSAQDSHRQILHILARLDASPLLCALLARIHQATFDRIETFVGGLKLEYPSILAAGMVKGDGFQSEAEALDAVHNGKNIIPGWRSLPRLVGLVEFGSFTRYPRMGNPGTVIWRDEKTRSTQNRVGLKNPGAAAAAAFLAKHRQDLPRQFGINIAVSPGVDDLEQQRTEVLEAAGAFFDQQLRPTWLTLNISCPNTEDDLQGRQTETLAQELCGTLVDYIREQQLTIPLWVKVSPGLAAEQYRILMRVFHQIGVSAVIATNTLGQPAPGNPQVIAGVGGGVLHQSALETVRTLAAEKALEGYALDVIGCGGVLDGQSYQDFLDCGVRAVQYWSALVYRGPLAPAIIQNELKHDRRMASSRRWGAAGY
jgi:dihydroorotate dehydrogenase